MAIDKTEGWRRPHALVYSGSVESHRPDGEVGEHSAML